MKQKTSFIFIVVLGLLAFQNVYSEKRIIKNPSTEPFVFRDTRDITYEDSTTTRFVLWRIYIQEPDDSTKKWTKVKVDSVLRESFYDKEGWHLYYYKREGTYAKGRVYAEKLNLIPNAYYLVLATANCYPEVRAEGACRLNLTIRDNFLPDTPENRKLLSKKWDETKVTYENWPSSMMINGGDSRKKKPDSVK